jgi:hypothetical protein
MRSREERNSEEVIQSLCSVQENKFALKETARSQDKKKSYTQTNHFKNWLVLQTRWAALRHSRRTSIARLIEAVSTLMGGSAW